MSGTASTIDELTLTITREIHVKAPIDVTFQALLEEMGPGNEGDEGKPMPMTLEAHPGGRWYRDLGDDNGHLWGFVQAIKRPTLLEITGPLFMSSAAINNVQYRLTEADGGTRIAFRHHAMGVVPDDMRAGMATGWDAMLDRVQRAVEGGGVRGKA